MTINLNFFKMKQSGVVGFGSTDTGLSKHKITINQPKQTHFSVDGVQSYAPEELKALKSKEDRLYQKKQGFFIKPTIVLLSDQFIQQQPTTDKLKNEKQKTIRPNTGNNKQIKRNVRNAMSMNNQQIVKLEKQRAKKDFLDRKLQKLVKLSKKHFQGVNPKQTDKESKDYQQQLADKQIGDSSISIAQKNEGTIKNTNDRSSKINKGQNDNNQFQQVNWMQKGNELINKVLTKSTYSQKLGSAIHNLFG